MPVTATRHCLVPVLSRSAKTSFPGRGPLRCAPWSFPPGSRKVAGPVSAPPAPSPCPGGVQPRILGCATPRQPRCPPAHRNRTGGRTATKATGLHGPPPKNKTQKESAKTRCRRCRSLCVLASSRREASRRHPTDAPTAFRGSADRRKEPGPRLGSTRDDEPENFPALVLWGRTLLPVSLVLLPGLAGLFLCGASGHTRRCRQPTDETPGRRGCRARLPTNTSERPQTRQRRHGLPETWVEGGGCCPCAGGALPRRFSPCVFQTEVDRKRYPDNLCEPPLVWSNFFKI